MFSGGHCFLGQHLSAVGCCDGTQQAAMSAPEANQRCVLLPPRGSSAYCEQRLHIEGRARRVCLFLTGSFSCRCGTCWAAMRCSLSRATRPLYSVATFLTTVATCMASLAPHSLMVFFRCSGSVDKTLRIWAADTGDLLGTLKAQAKLLCQLGLTT